MSLTIHPVWPSVAHESNTMVLCVVHDAEVANGIFPLFIYLCVEIRREDASSSRIYFLLNESPSATTSRTSCTFRVDDIVELFPPPPQKKKRKEKIILCVKDFALFLNVVDHGRFGSVLATGNDPEDSCDFVAHPFLSQCNDIRQRKRESERVIYDKER